MAGAGVGAGGAGPTHAVTHALVAGPFGCSRPEVVSIVHLWLTEPTHG